MIPEHTLPPRIFRLSTHLANQIAAGEVIERPASVIKELLENSLDAGATHVEVDVEQGGRRLIRVRDDGCGIHKDDLALALSRHATSKIRSLDDLGRVSSLGFRGEALPSISSVSRLTLTARTGDAKSGWTVRGEGSDADCRAVAAAHPCGTTVEVCDLFYNVPARRKFLRTDRTEFGHVEEVVRRLALSRFDVGITLRHNGRVVLALRPARSERERERRIAALCGKAFLEHALRAEFEAAGLRLEGWMGSPQLSRSQTDVQYFCLNGRVIRDKLVGHGVRQAYQDLLPQGRHPVYILYLEVSPDAVDVNVHPTKHEVRFRDARLVHDFIARALRGALSGAGAETGAAFAVPVAGQASAATGSRGVPSRRDHPFAVADQVAAYAALHRAEPGAEPRRKTREYGPLGRALAQVHGAYILAENDDGLVLVDLLAAQRRITQETLRAAREAGVIRARPLLIPMSVAMGAQCAQLVETGDALLRELGFDMDRIGPDTVLVRQIPAALGDVDVAALVAELLGTLAEGAGAIDDRAEELIALIAHHDAGAASGLTVGDMNELLRRVEVLEGSAARYGERPVWRQLSLQELGRMFGPGNQWQSGGSQC